jgi:hypothetical protein
MERLLQKGQNPNQYYALIQRKPLVYALENKKYRAFERLLQAPGIELDQVDSIGCTILGIVMQY